MTSPKGMMMMGALHAIAAAAALSRFGGGDPADAVPLPMPRNTTYPFGPASRRHDFTDAEIRVAGQAGMRQPHPKHWPKARRLTGAALERACADWEAMVRQHGIEVLTQRMAARRRRRG